MVEAKVARFIPQPILIQKGREHRALTLFITSA